MAFQTGHALLIGVGTYPNVPRLNVPVTAKDVQELANVLRDPQYCGYPDTQVTSLHDDTATRDGILGALDGLASKTTADDTVLLFYSGHGEYGEDNAYYLTTYDMRKNDQRKVVAGSAVKEADLLEKLQAIPAKRLILLFNACHSGEISPVLSGEAPADDVTEGARSLPDDAAAAILATGEGRIIITACRENQFSFVGSGPLTIFAQALVDGLRGKGTSSNGGFISAFELYTHLYYAIDRAVQKIPLTARKQYAGGIQQPELTVLKGVGPFPVALYKGAQATLGEFDASEQPDEETVVSRIDKKYSERMFKSFISIAIGDTKTAGRDIKEAGRDIVEKTAGRDLIEAAGDVNQAGGDIVKGDKVGGDKVGGDKVAGDKISTGDISGSSGIAIGRGAQSTVRNVTTGGGDYAEGNIDKRGSKNVTGDNIEISGSTLQNVNLKSTLTNVTQSIGALPNADQATKDELKKLIEQLSAELQKVPPDKAKDAATVTKRVESVVNEVGKPEPDKEQVDFSLESLKKAAANIGQVVPAVLTIATQIAGHISKLIV